MDAQYIINRLSEIALKQPNIHQVVKYSPSNLESLPDARFSVFSWIFNSVEMDEQFAYVSLNLFYIDRVEDDEDNKLSIQSNGTWILHNIITTLAESEDDVDIEGTIMYYPFYQKYKQMCAGVYADVELSIPIGLYCPELYE